MSESAFILTFVSVGIIFVTWIGIRTGRKASHTMKGWIVNDRNMGPVLTWFLLGTEIYTAFTFLGIAGFAFSKGGGAFYSVATNNIGYALGFFMLPAIGLVGRKFGYVTQSDFVAGRYQNRSLGIVVAFCAAIIMIAYIDLNIEGLGAILSVLTEHRLSEITAETIAFSVLSVAVLLGGIRGNAWQSAIKDVLMFGSLAALFVVVPYHYFGGFGTMFHAMAERIPRRITMPGPTPYYGLSWYWTTVLLNGFSQWVWPQFFNVAFSARDSKTLRLQAVFMPVYQLVKIAVTTIGFAAILIFATQKVEGNEVILLVAKQTFPAWLLAFFALAAALSAIVPTGPIIIMSCTLLARNVYAELRPGTSDKAIFNLMRVLIFVMTFAALLLAVFAHSLIVSVLLVAYDFMAQLIPGVMIGGLFWRRATGAGVFAGLIVGWTMVLVLLFTNNDPVWGLNAGFVALVANFIVFWLVSLASKPVSREFLDSYFSAAYPRKAA
jgi:SSS family solute:Na+ symporter